MGLQRQPLGARHFQSAGHLGASQLQERQTPYAPAGRRAAKAELPAPKAPGDSALAGAELPEYGRAARRAETDSLAARQDAGPAGRKLPCAPAPELPNAAAATCTVTTLADSGAGSLRACLLQAAANGAIVFDPSIFPPAAPAVIALASALPWITVNGLTIDASNAGVVLDGSGLTEGVGLVVSGAGNVTIRGLQILSFPSDGLELINGAHDCVIGGDRGTGAGPLGQGNLLSGNGDTGIWLEGPGTSGNFVRGNFIGTDLTGNASHP